jgi:ABC-type transport system involved in multi-copper enzyme maturation permease subunit
MFPIAWITLRRIAEKSVLVQFGILALVLIYVGLGMESIVMLDEVGSEQSGLGVTWLFLSAFTVFWSTMEIPREIDRKETHVYLAKPVGRLTYLVGKYLGMVSMILAGQILLLTVFAVCLRIKGHWPSADFLVGAVRVGLFLVLLNAVCAAASLLLSEIPAMIAVLFLLGVAIVACCLPVLAWSSFDRGSTAGLMSAYYLIPDLLYYRLAPPGGAGYYLGLLLGYTVGWSMLYLLFGWLVFRRIDLP